MLKNHRWICLSMTIAILLTVSGVVFAQTTDSSPNTPSEKLAEFVEKTVGNWTITPRPPSQLVAVDKPWDDGRSVILTWEKSPDDVKDGEIVDQYKIYKAIKTIGPMEFEPEFKVAKVVPAGYGEVVVDELLHNLTISEIKKDKTLKELVDLEKLNKFSDESDDTGYVAKFIAEQLKRLWPWSRKSPYSEPYDVGYVYKIVAVNAQGVSSSPAQTTTALVATMQWFTGARFFFMIIMAAFCGAVIFWIYHARQGKPIKVREIAGLSAVDEAVGRATEMGRSVLYVPGILDISDVQTITSMTILSRVAKTAARYDARLEVPTCRSLVMTTAQETVQSAFLSAGRPDAYNEDNIYYVTDEQFGYVAHLSGQMVREKPAACFYMGAFFAESLLLAETGNSIGAIQIAGTAMPSQLPFFVAACDYTLIGEEFFAASAYLSGSPEELGSLKGQDVGKIIVAVFIVLGVTIATVQEVTYSLGFTGISDEFGEVLKFLKDLLL